MTRRRMVLWGLTALVAVLLAGGLWCRQFWIDSLRANGIQQIDWQGASLSLNRLTVSHARVIQAQAGRQVAVSARDAALSWSWSWQGPLVQSLSVGQLDVDLRTPADESDPSPDASTLALPDQVPVWLPPKVSIDRFNVRLPCVNGRCPLSGSLAMTRPGSSLPLNVTLGLDHDGHHLDLHATLSGTLPGNLTLTTGLDIDGQQTLTGTTHYGQTGDDSGIRWDGEVALPALPRTDWLLAWLRQWQNIPLTDLPAHPETARLNAHWQLQGPAGAGFIDSVTGEVTVSGQVPQPWPIPAVATVQGDLELALRAEQGRWRADTAQADLRLTDPAGWIASVPASLRPESLAVRLRPSSSASADSAPGQLPLDIQVTSKQPSSITVQGGIVVATSAPWSVQLKQVRVQGTLADSLPATRTLNGLQADVTVSGKVGAQSLALSFGPSSTVSLAQLAGDSRSTPLGIEGLRAELAGVSLNARYNARSAGLETVDAQGPLVLSAESIRHPALRPQSWRLKGRFTSSLEQLSLEGQLSADSGSQVRVTLDDRFKDALTATAELTMNGKPGAEAWSRALADWPALLTVSEGQLDARATLHWPAAGSPEVQAHLGLTDLSGVYDRASWSGLSGDAEASFAGHELTATTSGITLNQLNPGIPIGPVTSSGQYQAPLVKPGAGRLTVKQATAGLFGGHASVEPDVFDLSQLPVRVPLSLAAIDLSKLMALYPADNLAGTGMLSGKVPLLLGPPAGIRIEAGRISARQPGGTLTLPAERLRSIGQGNQALDLVAKAMENFHYDTLNSTLAYDKDGTLTLGLHLEGNNPEVERGRPIVLNINLEEDIPALLTSLQMSGRVNDAVTERVRKLIEQRKNATSGQ